MKKTERKTKTTPVKIVGRTSALPERGSSLNDAEKEAENEVGEFPSLTEIKELIEFVSEKGFNEFELERGGLRLYWRKGVGEPAAPSRLTTNVPQSAGENRPVEFVPAPPAATKPAPAPAPAEEELHIVASPIVGTFYRSPSPTAEPFVKL